MIRRIELSDGWTVSAYAGAGLDRGVGSMPATVPGAVHADLMASGLIADPLLDRNETLAQWVGHTNWRYERALRAEDQVEPGTRLDLVFGGIDTAAVIAVDGVPLLSTENMHRSYRVDVTSTLSDGDTHALVVDIESPWTAAERHRDGLGPLPCEYPTPYNFLRTMACSFGWDWGPTVPGAALWRPVSLERWNVARLAAVRPLVRVWPNGLGAITVAIDLEYAEGNRQPSDLEVLTTLTGPDGSRVVSRATVPPGEVNAAVSVIAEDVQLWWPHTLGEPVLYDLHVALIEADGGVLDAWERQVGFRTIELNTSPDEFGSAFTLVVNGHEVFTKGVNWIPDDPFPARITSQQYADQVGEAVALGSDLLRIWGGGIYESEAFYEACDRLGVMVWQDFAFACAAYPEEEPFATEVAAEATEAVIRLMPHPSLVLWCGNNENLWGHVDWDWAEQTEGRTWGRGYYLDVLPEIVHRLDPTRPYWPGSPWSQTAAGDEPEIHPNDANHGCTHEWEVWNRVDLDHYRDQVPRFLSEFGWQAAPTWPTLREALDDEPLTAESPGVQAHQKAEDGDLKLARGLARHTRQQADGSFGPAVGGPAAGPDWVYRTQVVQARAVTTAVEHLRSHRGRCMGSIWWQLNDCWPSVSWSVIDSGRRIEGVGRRRDRAADRARARDRLPRARRAPVRRVEPRADRRRQGGRRADQRRTCPHYLCLEAEAIPDDGVLYKCSPPIREHDNREQLWRGVLDGPIDFVVTDHSPCTPHLKHVPGGLPDAWGGIASLQLGLPLLWSEARARGAGLAELAAWTSSRAARFAGVGARKGAIAPGHDADLVVWDPEAETEVIPERLFFRHRQQSPYIGARLHGRVQHTWLRGVRIFDGGAPIGAPTGRLLLGRDRPLGAPA